VHSQRLGSNLRREWLAVAWATLKHLPADILAIGCKAARQTCDHPSKIVPTIIAETKEMMGWRRDAIHYSKIDRPQLAKPHFVTPIQASEILKEFGLKQDPAA
jgi:hypothetical protein